MPPSNSAAPRLHLRGRALLECSQAQRSSPSVSANDLHTTLATARAGIAPRPSV
jgi:hypothetical protein